MSIYGNLGKEIRKIISQAGNILISESKSSLNIRTKSSDRDLVTQTDRKIEFFLIEKFSALLPGSCFLAEETDSDVKEADELWIIDPIDGTTNYVHQFPFTAISVALQMKGEIILGFVFNPVMNEFFEAELGKGSRLNGKTIQTSNTPKLKQSLLATGFAYNFESSSENNIRYFEHFHRRCHGIRRPGSAALDLCYVAKGCFDGFWEWYLNPWDVAAGLLIVQEAGGKVSAFDGKPYRFDSENILAANSYIYDEMLAEIRALANT